jgi:hypothetical protein
MAQKFQMNQAAARLRPGDLVEVRSPEEILRTLDSEGSLDRLPFMPEMVELCGKRLHVARRVLKTCYYGETNGMRKFSDDVVVLEDVRCSGVDHNGCQKACMIFWREAWLRRIEKAGEPPSAKRGGTCELRARLITLKGPNRYFCQASEILNATTAFSRWDRLGDCIDEVRAGNCSALEMAGRVASWLFWRLRRKLFGDYARGNNQHTPAESLRLQAGEWVEVKPVASIAQTLDERAHNRGLYFTPDMRQLCGQRRQVDRPLAKIIVDGTGEMRKMHNTVYLKGGMCGCIYALGGCPRGEFSYWREIWLKRVPATADPELSPSEAQDQLEPSV